MRLGHFMIVKQIITQVNRLFCQINRIHLSLHPVISSDELLFLSQLVAKIKKGKILCLKYLSIYLLDYQI